MPAKGNDRDTAYGDVPRTWMPDVAMDRIVCHWTAGGHLASESDREHYHILIEGDGRLVRGQFSIADNVDDLVWEPRNYAAHARGTNSRCIGISVCCMRDAIEAPFDAGSAPMSETQWVGMARVAATLCARYGIDVSRSFVLGHGEVQETLGNPQDGKWDPLALPWDPDLTKAEVGDAFRAKVQELLATRTNS